MQPKRCRPRCIGDIEFVEYVIGQTCPTPPQRPSHPRHPTADPSHTAISTHDIVARSCTPTLRTISGEQPFGRRPFLTVVLFARHGIFVIDIGTALLVAPPSLPQRLLLEY